MEGIWRPFFLMVHFTITQESGSDFTERCQELLDRISAVLSQLENSLVTTHRLHFLTGSSAESRKSARLLQEKIFGLGYVAIEVGCNEFRYWAHHVDEIATSTPPDEVAFLVVGRNTATQVADRLELEHPPYLSHGTVWVADLAHRRFRLVAH